MGQVLISRILPDNGVCNCLMWLVIYSNTLSHYIPQDGRTALMLASDSGHTDVVKLLLSSGAQVDLQDKVRHSINSIVNSS